MSDPANLGLISGIYRYYGQASWFKTFHPEQLPSVEERYVKEINRVTGVLNDWLHKQSDKHGDAGNGPWLVSNKMCYADVSFVMWQYLCTKLPGFQGDVDEDQYPFVKEWMAKLVANERISKVIENSMAAGHESSEWEGIDKYLT